METYCAVTHSSDTDKPHILYIGIVLHMFGVPHAVREFIEYIGNERIYKMEFTTVIITISYFEMSTMIDISKLVDVFVKHGVSIEIIIKEPPPYKVPYTNSWIDALKSTHWKHIQRFAKSVTFLYYKSLPEVSELYVIVGETLITNRVYIEISNEIHKTIDVSRFNRPIELVFYCNYQLDELEEWEDYSKYLDVKYITSVHYCCSEYKRKNHIESTNKMWPAFLHEQSWVDDNLIAVTKRVPALTLNRKNTDLEVICFD